MTSDPAPPANADTRRLLDQLQAAYRQLDLGGELAARIGDALLPRSLPRLGGVSVSAAGRSPGQLYDAKRVGERRLVLWLAEVPTAFAGTLGPFVKAATESVVWAEDRLEIVPPADVLRRVNDALLALKLDPPPLVAMTYALVDGGSGAVTLSRGGSAPAVQVYATGERRAWLGPAPFLGAFPAEFSTFTGTLRPGERLSLRTLGECEILLAVESLPSGAVP